MGPPHGANRHVYGVGQVVPLVRRATLLPSFPPSWVMPITASMEH
jgi:hypothetical protein